MEIEWVRNDNGLQKQKESVLKNANRTECILQNACLVHVSYAIRLLLWVTPWNTHTCTCHIFLQF